MKRSHLLNAVVALATLAASAHAAAQTADAPAKTFSHPDRIRYDRQCFTIDGQDVFLFSGAFHYFRTPKELWHDRFARIKAAGFNAVETYVAWNWSERQMPAGPDDTSHIDLSDLRDWMKMAHEEFGLYTIIRPGPYICAEWLSGGYPAWLWAKRPADFDDRRPWVRSADPTYLAWSEHWMQAVWKVVAPEQITRKPKGGRGVVLVQIENEYDFFRGVSEDERIKHLKSLYAGTKLGGIDVPVFSCMTRQTRRSADPDLAQVFDAGNYYHRWNLTATRQAVRGLHAAQPDAPVMISELQGGWFGEVGGMMSEDQDGVDAAQCNAITLTAVANGATALNYYMLVGGTNFGAWGAGSMLQTYDYNAPIHETGGRTEKYAAVKAIGDFLNAHGVDLARAELVSSKVVTQGVSLEVTARRDKAGQHYLFVRNPAKREYIAKCEVELDGGPRVSIDHHFPPQIVTVLVLPPGKTRDSDGEWACEPIAAPERPAVPGAVRIASAMTRPEPGPALWRPIKTGESLVAAGVYDIGDVTYRATPTFTKDQLADYAVVRVGSAIGSINLAMRVNGTTVAGTRGARRTDFPVDGLLIEGRNTIELVYQNTGVGHFGDRLRNEPGLTEFSLVSRGAAGRGVTDWKVALVGDGDAAADVRPAFDDSAWDKVVLDAKSFAELAASKQPGASAPTYPAIAILNGKHATAVYRTSFELTDKDIAAKSVRLELGGIDDHGEVFVNGTSVGTSRDWNRPYTADITAAVKPGRNTLAVRVTNTDADGGLTRPATLYTDNRVLPLDSELGTAMAGLAGGWPNTIDLSGWSPLALNTDQPLPAKGPLAFKPVGGGAMQTWTRTEFELPTETPGVWCPWGAIIHASGNGFVYLNGHELGRYFHVGPQRRFYLPEPWLKRGPSEKNVLTLSLNAAVGEPRLFGLGVAPFAEHAERR